MTSFTKLSLLSSQLDTPAVQLWQTSIRLAANAVTASRYLSDRQRR